MTIEFLNKRIEGANAKIAKLEAKLARIQKAAASNWENNPYYYGPADLKYTENDLVLAKEALAKYEATLAQEQEKAASRNVTVIVEFLDRWQKRCEEHYVNLVPRFIEARKEYFETEHKYNDWFSTHWAERRTDEGKRKRKEADDAKKAFDATWGFIFDYMGGRYGDDFDLAKLKKDLKVEADRKYDFIVERTNDIVGQITDASGLTIGDKDDLNGLIIGTRGAAKVQTIGAGGYNIQCFHFRTLIHKA